jgi:hypothetical protein
VRSGDETENRAMLIVFEVIVAAGHDPDTLLSDEVLAETQAQVMTPEEATALGFQGVRPDPKGREVRLIAVAPRDSQFVQRRLEANGAVQSFRPHEVDM